ncbi:MAG: hypothetical protein FVQ82_09410 [Planctomycetes bacterium]|nr:hypothetical protein [Planctomycetota bacterium]
MLKCTVVLSTLLLFMVSTAANGEYEYYKGSQFPGKGLRKDVEIRTVVTEGGKPTEYKRREVKFFPRKGVDSIPVVYGMIKRDWTLTELGKSFTPKAFLKGDKLNAHLIGFRGIGTKHDAPSMEQPNPPAVVLRLPDGSKRAYTGKSFSDADIKVIMPIFNKEMARIRNSAIKVKYDVPSGFRAQFPDIAKPGEPGTMLMTTDHFAWGGGSQNPKSPFIGKTLKDGDIYRSFLREWMENMWTLYEYSGDLMPYWDRPMQYKYTIKVGGTKRDGHEGVRGGAGGSYGSCVASHANVGIIAHEYGHGIRPNALPMGGGEAGADTSSVFCYPGRRGCHHTVSPYRNVFNGFSGYGYVTFWTLMGDNPNLGYGWFNAIPAGHDEGNPLVTIARMLEQRGIAKNGIRGLGDLFGEYAARMSNFDLELQGDYRKQIYAPTRQWLEPVDLKENIWRVPMGNAPEPFGMNVVRIIPEKGDRKIGIDFLGYHDPKTYSDWRVCLSRVKADGTITYSGMINKGKLVMNIEPDDASIWMTVAATPTAVFHAGKAGKGKRAGKDGREGMDGVFASGVHAFRYPWKAEFLGCTPGSLAHFKDEYGKDNAFNKNTYAPRHPSTTAPAAPAGGKFHKNGGGWVANSAKVDASAYVGKNAMVLGNAKVLGNASIEDFAIVKDKAVVKDNAKISGGAVITAGAVFDEYDRTWVNEPISYAQVKKHKEPIAREVPARGESPKLHPESLLVNYAMESPNNVLLEDFYRTISATGYAKMQEPNYNGYLTGQPRHFADGDRIGFRFNGKNQWAELSPQAFDLASATMDMTIRLDGSRSGTIFDFGSSKDDNLVLSVSYSGRLQLVGTVKGQRVLLLNTRAVKRNKWMQVRIEMDGKKASLYVDNKLSASKMSPIRPCDFYLPDAVDSNLLAANRDGYKPLAVSFDYVVIYHTVHEDFSKLNPPRMDTPIMPDAQYIASYKKYVDKINAINKTTNQGRPNFDKDKAILKPYKDKAKGRMKELLERNPRFSAAKKALAAKENEIDTIAKNVADEYDATPEGRKLLQKEQQLRKEYDDARKELDAYKDKFLVKGKVLSKDKEYQAANAEKEQADRNRSKMYTKVKAELRKKNPKLNDHELNGRAGQDYRIVQTINAMRNTNRVVIRVRESIWEKRKGEKGTELEKKEKRLREERRPIQDQRRNAHLTAATAKTRKAKMELISLKKDVVDAEADAYEPYAAELEWLDSFEGKTFGRSYNANYDSYFRSKIAAGGTGITINSEVSQLQKIAELGNNPAVWRTEVNWDWRTPEEVDGSIAKLPLMKKWIERNRGPIQKSNPAKRK